MSEKTWPETVCARDDDPRRSLKEPMRVDGWKVCTDAKMLVAVESSEECEPANDHNAEEIRRSLSLELRDLVTFDLDALREWCGPAEEDETRECRCDCGHVHNLAVSRYDIDRVGSLFDVPFNKRLLAAMLDGAPGDAVHIVRPEEDYRPFLVVGEGWRGVLMPLRPMALGDDEYDPLDGLALEVAS